MANRGSQIGGLLAGAVLGAMVAFLLVPESRRWVRGTVRGWVRDLLESDLEEENIHHEAGAPEGGLAATRGWQM